MRTKNHHSKTYERLKKKKKRTERWKTIRFQQNFQVALENSLGFVSISGVKSKNASVSECFS